MFNNSLDDKTKGPSLWVFVVGFAAAALLTLTAAVGTSMLHRQNPETDPSKLPSPSAEAADCDLYERMFLSAAGLIKTKEKP